MMSLSTDPHCAALVSGCRDTNYSSWAARIKKKRTDYAVKHDQREAHGSLQLKPMKGGGEAARITTDLCSVRQAPGSHPTEWPL